jgi:hypothetical protein
VQQRTSSGDRRECVHLLESMETLRTVSFPYHTVISPPLWTPRGSRSSYELITATMSQRRFIQFSEEMLSRVFLIYSDRKSAKDRLFQHRIVKILKEQATRTRRSRRVGFCPVRTSLQFLSTALLQKSGISSSESIAVDTLEKATNYDYSFLQTYRSPLYLLYDETG